jgi:ribokinase
MLTATPDVMCIASWNTDLTSHVPRPIARGETLMASGFEVGPGGKGSNAAIACARQGARVGVVARIGDDDFGRMALSIWQREGIDTRAVEVVTGEPSGVAQIWVYPDGDNSIAVAPGAGAGLGERQVRAAADALQRARVVMAPCEVPLEATWAAFRIARAAGAFTLLNPAPACPLPDDLVALCDLLTPNEAELRALTGLPEDTPADQAAAQLLARGAGAVAVTLGAQGCTLYRPGHPPLTVPGHRMAVIDTVGAGDTCTGALAAALARGLPLETALPWANAAAALSVTGRGAIQGMPRMSAVQDFLSARTSSST